MPTQTLASNTRQARKLLVMTWICTALPIGACVWAAWVDPAMFVIAAIGALWAVAMHLYLRRYVTSLELDGDTLVVRTAAIGSPVHRIPRARLG